MPTKALRPRDWSLPSRPVEREVLSRLPDGPSDRPPILFVHGEYHGAWCWDEHWMPEAATRGWPCYAVSLRGHGGSGGHDRLNRWILRDYVQDVLEVIDELPAEPVIVGHSFGGLVVQRVLNRHTAVAGVLVASFPPHGGYRLPLRIGRRHPTDLLRVAALQSLPPRRDYFFSDRLDEATVDAYRDRLGPESALAQIEAALPRRPLSSEAPVLVLGAEDDALIDPVDVVHTAQAYGTQARLFREMGHDMMLDAGWRAPLEVMLRWLEDEVVGDSAGATAWSATAT